MQKVLTIVAVAVLAAVLFWFFPLFHIVRVGEGSTAAASAPFSASELAGKLWHDKLPAAIDRAADLTAVLETFRQNPKQVREKFGRSAGLGRAYLLLVRGRGTIESIDKHAAMITLDQSDAKSSVVLVTGPLFGNTVRDAANLAAASDFANSQQFNDLSTELNGLAESQVIGPFSKDAKLGSKLRFVACAEILNEPGDFQPLKLIPVQIAFE